ALTPLWRERRNSNAIVVCWGLIHLVIPAADWLVFDAITSGRGLMGHRGVGDTALLSAFSALLLTMGLGMATFVLTVLYDAVDKVVGRVVRVGDAFCF